MSFDFGGEVLSIGDGVTKIEVFVLILIDADGEDRAREWMDYATARVPEMQMDEMRRAATRGVNLSFADGERALNVQNRSGQRPRVFYRREIEAQPLVVARH